jgi:hypothetical protein
VPGLARSRPRSVGYALISSICCYAGSANGISPCVCVCVCVWCVVCVCVCVDLVDVRYINPIMHGQRNDASRREVAMGRIAAVKFSKLIKQLILRRDKTLIQDRVRTSSRITSLACAMQ